MNSNLIDNFSPKLYLKRTCQQMQTTTMGKLTVSNKPIVINDLLSATTIKQNFQVVKEPILQKKQPYHSKFIELNPSIASTTEVERTISQHINEDNSLSEKDVKQKFRQHSYRHITNTLAYGRIQNIPSMIKKAFLTAERLKKKGQQVNFKQGFLQGIGYFYYCIEKTLYLVNGTLIGHEQFENQKIIQFQLRDIVIAIKEVQFKSKAIKNIYHQKILIVSHPWELNFYSYKINLAEITIIDLKMRYPLQCQKVSLFDYNFNGVLYYLDDKGELNEVITSQNKIPFFKNTTKYSLRNRRISSFNFHQFFQRNSKSVFQTCKFFFKTAYQKGRSCLPTTHSNINLFYDGSRQLLFTFTQINNIWFLKHNSKYIKMYRIENKSKPRLVNTVTQEEIQNQLRYNYFFDKKTCHIKNIEPVLQVYEKQSNLLVIFTNGIRMYLHITAYKTHFVQVLYPPNFNQLSDHVHFNPNQDNIIVPKESSEVELISYHLKRDVFVGVSRVNRNCTCWIIHKNVEKDDHENIQKLQWQYEIQTEDIPIIYQLASKVLVQPSFHSLISLHSKMHSCAQIPAISQLHHYAKQVYYSAAYYYYCNDEIIQTAILLRPIDTLFTILNEFNLYSCEKIIEYHLRNTPIRQICSMLMQIYLDQSAEYYVNRQLVQLIYNDLKIKPKFEQRYSKLQKQNKILKIHFTNIPSEIFILCMKLIDLIAIKQNSNYNKRNNNYKQDYYGMYENKFYCNQSPHSSIHFQTDTSQIKIDAFITYLSRVIRLLWHCSISKISISDCEIFIKKITPFKSFISELGYWKNSKIDSQVQNFTVNLKNFIEKLIQFMYVCQFSSNQLPFISLQSALSKNYNFFETYLFQTLRKHLKSSTIEHWNRVIPLYVSQNFYRMIKIYDQIEVQTDGNKIMELLKQYPTYPQYFIDYLYFERKIEAAKNLMVEGKTSNIAIKINLPQQGDLVNQINSTLSEIKLSQHSLEEKQFLLGYIGEKINALHEQKQYNELDLSYKKLNKQYRYYKKCIKIQQLIKKQYETYKQTEPQILCKLNQQTYSQEFLSTLIDRLDCPKLQLVYHIIFHSEQSCIKKKLNLLLYQNYHKYQEQNIKPYQQLQYFLWNDLLYVFQQTFKKFPIAIVMEITNKKFIENIQSQSLIEQIQKIPMKNTKDRYLGCFLGSIGCNLGLIYEYLIVKLQNQYCGVLSLTLQTEYLYCWLQIYGFIHDYYRQGCRNFIVLAKDHLSELDHNETISKNILTKMNKSLEQFKTNKI